MKGIATQMIHSVGIDIVDLNRIRHTYETYGDKFLMRIYSPDEIIFLMSSPGDLIRKIAGRFAAKEAVIKALGHFFDSGVFLRDIEILCREGQAVLVRLPKRLQSELNGSIIMVSLSEQSTIAMAVAIISDEA